MRTRTREESARTIAENAVAEVREALMDMRVVGDVDVAGVVNGHGLVNVSLLSADAYAFARWIRGRVAEEEQGTAQR